MTLHMINSKIALMKQVKIMQILT
ncbi:hypothetical protein BOH78_3598 [Pichia kudriavzevii]|uniref:Uncharacterized protein n=1 Tax=Pichia kudriavzevii TaxID=4909 RepID=A0A1V2LJN7_PICKU|nr:hypothetical protein BOH78_5091 [Pichia kudriavzevii]ONH70768.1 hypothetical protein BOH78_4979 [Pichia kudriavzevii]ONH72874.1 hypothetical protein BOH78_3598 [Pichia kudriavzevii]